MNGAVTPLIASLTAFVIGRIMKGLPQHLKSNKEHVPVSWRL